MDLLNRCADPWIFEAHLALLGHCMDVYTTVGFGTLSIVVYSWSA